MLTPLCELARKYGSDKFSAKHSYTEWYYNTFKDRRETVRKVVEIGVGEGASLRMWRDFFPNAMIYGADIDPKRCFQSERIDVTRCDQANILDLEQLIAHTGPDVDLFIDDGSHNPVDQSTTSLLLMGILSPNVVYVIEDVANEMFKQMDAIGYYEWKAPRLEYRKRYDTRRIVVKHV